VNSVHREKKKARGQPIYISCCVLFFFMLARNHSWLKRVDRINVSLLFLVAWFSCWFTELPIWRIDLIMQIENVHHQHPYIHILFLLRCVVLMSKQLWCNQTFVMQLYLVIFLFVRFTFAHSTLVDQRREKRKWRDIYVEKKKRERERKKESIDSYLYRTQKNRAYSNSLV
jgi:hypothetical protein